MSEQAGEQPGGQARERAGGQAFGQAGEQAGGRAGGRVPVTRALVSVYDKTGLEELARGLHAAGVKLVSTGSTAQRIADAGVPVTRVEDLTGFPECLDGRVKTLHPRVHAGLLADVRLGSHRDQLAELGVEPFELLVSNLYPFSDTVASGASPQECVEQIDIGGPSMVRAAAKNFANVAVVTSPVGYDDVLAAVRDGGFTIEQRQRLAAQAFAHTATYDVAVAGWFAQELGQGSALETVQTVSQESSEPDQQESAPESVQAVSQESSEPDQRWPDFAGLTLRRAQVLRYGENPHQPAALYVDASSPPGLASAEQLHGKEMSYNNYVDAQAAQRAAYDHAQPCVAIVKHTNPCGIAIGADVAQAHRRAHACDPVSAFGGVIAVNRPLTLAMAEQVAEVFTEVVVAPAYEVEALEVLSRKKNVRLLRTPEPAGSGVEWRPVSGGGLFQVADRLQADGDDPASWQLASGPAAESVVLADLAFAWRACRAVKSNAILLASHGATVGVGMGQVNRVDSARLAVTRAGERAAGSVAASDAFFPFADGLTVLLDAGVRAVVQPGGSVRDEEVVAAARDAGVTLYLTGARHFFH